jgi:FkbM family methyltransferase
MSLTDKINRRPWPNWGLIHEIGNSNDGEDNFVISYLNGKRNGFLVDVGACDGVTGTNSLKLINNFSWGAILIECNPSAVEYLKFLHSGNTDVHIEEMAVSLQTGEADLYFSKFPGTHTISEDFKKFGMHSSAYTDSFTKVKCDTLNNILFRTLKDKKIDFLSLDVEGLDLDIIKNFNFTINKPSVVIVEWPNGTKDRNYIHNLEKRGCDGNKDLIVSMNSKNYFLKHSTYSNAIFVNDEWK